MKLVLRLKENQSIKIQNFRNLECGGKMYL